MTSPIFLDKNRRRINARLKIVLNQQEDYLSGSTAGSTRAAGDALQSLVGTSLRNILGNLSGDYSDVFARRAMADVTFKDSLGNYKDSLGNYHVVDVKTHREDVSFSMPNLISVEWLCRFYEANDNFFDVLLISYLVEGNTVKVSSCDLFPIEWLDWGCLTIGALGWGQIQIANAKNVTIRPQLRRDWMLTFCDRILAFYPKEIVKVNKRIAYFEKAKAFWVAQEEGENASISLPTLPVDEGEVG